MLLALFVRCIGIKCKARTIHAIGVIVSKAITVKSEVITVGGKKAIIYDLHENYEIHLLSSDMTGQTDVLNIIYYLTEEGFLPDEKPVGIILIPNR